ncbi:MAG: hypothetical protein LM556_00330 [Desulfurococcaceae archaeon]|nr:hypothetical protein [Desulfurococcaceae archaeon]
MTEEKTSRGYLHIQLDFLCDMGFTSRLFNALKTAGLNPRQVSYDYVRVHCKIELNETSGALGKLRELLERQAGSWRELCIEAWIETYVNRLQEAKSSSTVLIGSIPVYFKPGSKSRVYYKIIWSQHKGSAGLINLPESMTRHCIQGKDVQSLRKAFELIEEFTMHFNT